MAVITLTTDFGTRDEYVGVLKGVICSIASRAQVIDLSHDLDPQDVAAAAFLLKSAFKWFPAGSIHVTVVDPGVGTLRTILAARLGGHRFIAPDNGVLTPLVQEYGADEIVAVQNRTFFKEPVSRTFHGRDIFAPVAAHLALGVSVKALGPPFDPAGLVQLDWTPPYIDPGGWLHGHVVWADRFGNLITDINHDHLKALAPHADAVEPIIQIGDHTIHGLSDSYQQGPHDAPAAIIGSRDCLEIALRQGSARELLAVNKGAVVRVWCGQPSPGMER